MARLQGFGNFTTTIADSKVRRLIGNAFTVPVLREVLRGAMQTTGLL